MSYPAIHCALAMCVIAVIMLLMSGAFKMRLIAVQAMEIAFVITSSPLSRGECSNKMSPSFGSTSPLTSTTLLTISAIKMRLIAV